MRWLPAPAIALSMLAAACGGDDAGGKCNGAPCPPGASGAGGASGAPSNGGSGNAGSGNGGSGVSGAGGSPSDACATIGGTLTGSQACYVSCLYDGSLVPTYDRNGDCTKFGSKCGTFNYCMPNINCTADNNCGVGRACGLGGQCLIACVTDADCPAPPGGAPLQCKPVDSGTLVCRPFP